VNEGNATHESAMVEAAAPRLTTAGEHMTGGERARAGAYRYRFAAIYFVLAAVVGAAVGASIVLLSRDTPPPARWSSFEPDGSRVAKVRQIADRVTRGYRDGGRQLVFAVAGPPQVSIPGQGDVGVTAIAVQPDTSRGQREEGDYDVYDGDSAIAFRLCGGGDSCSIAVGTPSARRLDLLRREALELSLYTFKYVGGVDSVVVFLPPPPPTPDGEQQTSGALFLRRDDVAAELRMPLARTLPTRPPLAPGSPSPADQANVDRLTRPHVYSYSHEAVADGVYLVLAPSTATP
jgi:hypothetical protein